MNISIYNARKLIGLQILILGAAEQIYKIMYSFSENKGKTILFSQK